MLAEIITIGDEILIGQVIDSNSAWIAELLNQNGIRVIQITSIADDSEQIRRSLDEAANRAQLVLLTGGLGPTTDDITKRTLVNYFGSSLVINDKALDNLKTFLASRGVDPNRMNLEQALLPDNCFVIPNQIGTASGMWFTSENINYISMPGVPYEMKKMMTEYILPALKEKYNLPSIIHKTINTQGIPESHLVRLLTSFEENLPESIRLAYLPSPGIVRLRLSSYGDNENSTTVQINAELEKMIKIIPAGNLIGMEDDNLEKVIGKLLINKKRSLSTAESCTGGSIARMITSVPGSSRYFKGSVVAYSNEIKIRILGVNEHSIDSYGAVSEKVVMQMVQGVKELFLTDYALATSGIAGPDGGSPEKPIGTTWIAVASRHKSFAEIYHFGDERTRNIEKASATALNMLRKLILSEK